MSEVPQTETVPTSSNIMMVKFLSQTMPKISREDPRSSALPELALVGIKKHGNFFQRFIDVKAVQRGNASESQIKYLRMTKERFGLDLMAFCAENAELHRDILDAIFEKETYEWLKSTYFKVRELETLGLVDQGLTSQIDSAIDHPLGVEAIGLYCWDRINTLLDSAYSQVGTWTANAPFLTK